MRRFFLAWVFALSACAATPRPAPRVGPVSVNGDRDQDGVPDLHDKCPDEPEDHDGFQDEDGCPDRDNDSDRIPDYRDKCPNDAEVYNGDQDDDGRPTAAGSGPTTTSR